MTGPSCQPLSTLTPMGGPEQRPDRLAELLECLADLMVEARRGRLALTQHESSDDPRVLRAIDRLSELERRVADVGAEAALVHQELQRDHLI
jgi:hypothetical protein